MNKFFREAYCVPCGALKMAVLKLTYKKNFKGPWISLISPLTEVTLDKGGKLFIGEKFRMRDGAKIRVRKDATCRIGENTSINCNNMIACHKSITIGNDVMFSPNVQIYDHDHDFRVAEGVKAGKYKTEPIIIGNNVWIGANTIILRGTVIGDNTVIAAGCVIKGVIPPNSKVYQKRELKIQEV